MQLDGWGRYPRIRAEFGEAEPAALTVLLSRRHGGIGLKLPPPPIAKPAEVGAAVTAVQGGAARLSMSEGSGGW